VNITITLIVFILSLEIGLYFKLIDLLLTQLRIFKNQLILLLALNLYFL